jgi:hypothetical protein
VQFLGDRDTIVKRDDSRDVLAFPNGRYLEIPGATHSDLYRLKAPYTVDPKGRFALIRYGIQETKAPQASLDPKPPRRITKVVFVLHGIRALTTSDWISDLGAEIRGVDIDTTRTVVAEPGAGDATLVIHPEYGWLTAVRFAIPFFRERYLSWFADRFAEAFAEYPRADFLAVAHSNGTYILGQNLLRLSGMDFKRIALAGSVLPVDFPWDTLRARSQVVSVQNYRANRDWPVGLLCAGLRALGFTDVGTGGFDGFHGSTVNEIAHLRGGHGAAFDSKSRRQHVIGYLMRQENQRIEDKETATDPTIFRMLSHLMSYIAWGIVAAAGLLGLWVWRGGQRRWRRLLPVGVFLFFVYLILDIV